MASFFSKFARGATQAGATLYADVARDQMKAEIQTKRDSVLNDNRTEAARISQEASTLQHQHRLKSQNMAPAGVAQWQSFGFPSQLSRVRIPSPACYFCPSFPMFLGDSGFLNALLVLTYSPLFGLLKPRRWRRMRPNFTAR